MQLLILSVFTMTAFAANSILTRMAVDSGHIDPTGFAILRVLAGAVVLGAIIVAKKNHLQLFHRRRAVGALSLAVYMVGFSLAYLTLDAGLGALVMFGVVQIFMFAFTTATGTRPTGRQLMGATIAFSGLTLALWPGAHSTSDPTGAALMVAAGIGWAIYTLSGRAEPDPLAATTANFILCLPIVTATLIWFSAIADATVIGWGLAVMCGGVTSGWGYALWYRVLPQLPQNLAPIVQLSVPIIALLGGAVLLGEAVSLAVAIAAILVVCGIALAVTSRSLPKDRR
ncbi:DMT family transporter [Roseobacter sp.]|uniref:DMT family transporter n=1 Tax=Roseobacter sp. TaxID=1907202 RepID=UPI003298E069